MKKRALNWEETVDEIVVNVSIFFLVVLTTAAALNFVSLSLVLRFYAFYIVVGIVIACVSSDDPTKGDHEINQEHSVHPERPLTNSEKSSDQRP